MTPSLRTLPLELILLIFELGLLEVGDAMTLRSTCKSLFAITESRIFWIALAKLHERFHSLPIPPHRLRASLTSKELQKCCFKAHYTIQNIASERPAYKNHRVLTVPSNTHAAVSMIIILAGGQFALIAQKNGIVGLWDYCASAERESPNLGANTDSTTDSNTLGISLPNVVGKLLGSYDTGAFVSIMDHLPCESHDKTVIIATIGSLSNGITTISVFKFIWISVDQVEATEYYRRDDIAGHFHTLTLSDDFVTILWAQLDNRVLEPMIIGYRTGRVVDVNTGIIVDVHYMYDALGTKDGHILLYASTESCLSISAYLEVESTLFSSNHASAGAPPLIKIYTPPHAAMEFPYSSLLPENRDWNPMHAWRSIHNKDRSMAGIVMASENYSEDDYPPGELPDLTMVSAQWLDMNNVFKLLKAPHSTSHQIPTLQPVSHVIRHPTTLRPGLGDYAVQLLAYGQEGGCIAWVVEITEGIPPTHILEVLPLPGPFEEQKGRLSGEALSSRVRPLELPLPLGRLSALELCDQFWTLAVAVLGEGDEDPSVHFFDY